MTLPARFWAKVDQNGPEAFHSQTGEPLGRCWVWTAATVSKGYGLWTVGSRTDGSRVHLLAHRSAYEAIVGPIESGLELDHLCRVHACVNPKHLEPVAHGENARRGALPEITKARHAAITHCPQGHAYTAENTRLGPTRSGGVHRQCRTCARLQARARRAGAG